MLAKVLAGVTESEARSIFEALDQFVDNGRDHADAVREIPEKKRSASDEKFLLGLAHAEMVLDRMNARLASLAEMAEVVGHGI